MKENKQKLKIIAVAGIVIIILVIGFIFKNKSEAPRNDKEENKETTTVDDITEDDISQAVEERGDFKVYTDDDGNNIGYNLGYLNEMPDDNYSETDFEKEVNAGYEYIRTGEYYEDTLNIADSGILYKDVISMINKMYSEYKAETYKICEIPENQEDVTAGLVYIVRFDYDYYILTYYDNEGVTALHDDTAYYASIYSDSTESLEDEEWVDDGYDGALVEENIIEDDWLYSEDTQTIESDEAENIE